MTAEKFGEMAADLWRARQRFEAARKRLDKRGLVIKQRGGKLRANPAIKGYAAAAREMKRLTIALLAA
jgi:phage terminase small subunit